MSDNRCLNCGKEFRPEKGKKYCGAACRSVYNYKTRITNCERSEDPVYFTDCMQSGRMHAMSEFLAKLQASGQVHR